MNFSRFNLFAIIAIVFLFFPFIYKKNVQISTSTVPSHFIDIIKDYQSYDETKLNDYYECYLSHNNPIYALNKINYPDFLNLDTVIPAFTADNIVLVNPKFYVDKQYNPSLTSLNNLPRIIRENETMMLNPEAKQMYELLLNDAKALNLDLIIYSAYRTYDKQSLLYQGSTAGYVAKPGHSEHHTGLALDIGTLDSGLTIHFENTLVYDFLVNNAYKYGFILRYPRNKEHLTGYLFEPWHYRYVGIKHAKIIHEQDLTLEEYIYQFIEIPI